MFLIGTNLAFPNWKGGCYHLFRYDESTDFYILQKSVNEQQNWNEMMIRDMR